MPQPLPVRLSRFPARARRTTLAIAAAVATFAAIGAVSAAPTFVNGLALPGAALDASGGTNANDGRLGYFSDLYYDPSRREWWGLSDRGPGGGTLDYAVRANRFTVDIDAASGAVSNFRIAQTVVLRDGGTAFNGRAPGPSSQLGRALDPEGLVVLPGSGNLLVSDEYGPSLIEFDRAGNVVRRFASPANLVPRDAATGTPNYASDTGNTAGKRTNRGFEGLAISPDGRFAYAMLQSATLDEGGGDGIFSRIVKFDVATGQAVAQYAYPLKRSGQGQGISALVAINDHAFYVLERNNRGLGVGAALATADKEVFRIDLAGATDVSAIDLDAPGAAFTPVQKSSRVLDLDADTLAALGGKSPEKWEGLSIGPRLTDGSYVVLAGTDNDYSVTQSGAGTQFDVWFRFSDADPYATSIQCPLDMTTGCTSTPTGQPATLPATGYELLPGVLHAYRFDAALLADYVAPAAVDEPGAATLAGAALAAAAALGRRRRGARAIQPDRTRALG